MRSLIYFSAFLNVASAGLMLLVLSESKDPVAFGLLIANTGILAVLGLLLIHKGR
jgi:hypothetical protein